MRLRRTSRDRHRYRNRKKILGENQFWAPQLVYKPAKDCSIAIPIPIATCSPKEHTDVPHKFRINL